MTVNEFGCIEIGLGEVARMGAKKFTAVQRSKFSCEDCFHKGKKSCFEYACSSQERKDGMYVKVIDATDN